VLGNGFTLFFFLRSLLLSLVLTFISVPGGQAIQASWGWTGTATIAYLVPFNIAFDLATVFITIVILSKALSKPDYFLLALILVDIAACFVLFYNAVYIADQFDTASMLSVDSYWRRLPMMIQATSFG
jgi:hypothetical protein